MRNGALALPDGTVPGLVQASRMRPRLARIGGGSQGAAAAVEDWWTLVAEGGLLDPVRCAPMSNAPHVTRFAPSPTGSLHLGNARTALFNHLAARASGGRMILRVEDTDAERSDESHLQGLLQDLRWLGVEWDEGPDVGGPRGPYRQSERGQRYAAALSLLRARGLAYPCFCSPEELAISRRAQLAAGRPPRYAGTCAGLPAEEAERRIAEGRAYATRFRVPPRRTVEFEDVIHGHQRFASDDIGDFVVSRADGSVAFFLGNAVDDADMGVTLVLRGDDHLANTPRQILLLEALGLPVPRYGHLPLVLGPTGAPLSKREGAASLHDLREQGYLPGALTNYLVRLGHACAGDEWLETAQMPSHFDLARSSRSPARFDEAQLRHWQREAVTHATIAQLAGWLGSRLGELGDAARKGVFVEAVRGNLLFPVDVEPLVAIVCREEVPVEAEAATAVVEAGPGFFDQAVAVWATSAGDFKAWARAVGESTGRKGARLYQPLRAALTGLTHGPELAPLAALMGRERVAARLAAAGRLAAARAG
ncbi:MAG TPA: glutamate--tRNA ligase [Steroidobacteraceae bacterium]|nr:glutamate--tRNA ligase [Steroidobacteraceae bacterium]